MRWGRREVGRGGITRIGEGREEGNERYCYMYMCTLHVNYSNRAWLNVLADHYEGRKVKGG